MRILVQIMANVSLWSTHCSFRPSYVGCPLEIFPRDLCEAQGVDYVTGEFHGRFTCVRRVAVKIATSKGALRAISFAGRPDMFVCVVVGTLCRAAILDVAAGCGSHTLKAKIAELTAGTERTSPSGQDINGRTSRASQMYPNVASAGTR